MTSAGTRAGPRRSFGIAPSAPGRTRRALPFEQTTRGGGALWAPRLVALLVLAQLMALGANGPLLALISATLDIALAIALLVLLPPARGFWRRAWPASLLGLALCIWAAVPAVAVAALGRDGWLGHPAPDLALPGAVRIFGGCATLLAATLIGYRRGLARAASDWLIVAIVVDTIVGLLLRQWNPGAVWGWPKTIQGARFTGTMLNANAESCLAGVAAILAFGRLQLLYRRSATASTARSLGTLGCSVAVVLAVGTCAITGSRVGLMLTVASLAAMAALDRTSRRALLSRRGTVALGAGAVAIALLVATFGGVTLDRFSALGHDAVDRLTIWHHYAALAAQALVTGFGIGAFSEINAATLSTPADAMALWYVNSAHDEPIELLLEGGPVFCALLAALVGTLLISIAPAWKWRRTDPQMVAIPFAILVILLESLVDIVLDVPAMATLLIILTGLLFGRSRRMARRSRYFRERGDTNSSLRTD